MSHYNGKTLEDQISNQILYPSAIFLVNMKISLQTYFICIGSDFELLEVDHWNVQTRTNIQK